MNEKFRKISTQSVSMFIIVQPVHYCSINSHGCTLCVTEEIKWKERGKITFTKLGEMEKFGGLAALWHCLSKWTDYITFFTTFCGITSMLIKQQSSGDTNMIHQYSIPIILLWLSHVFWGFHWSILILIRVSVSDNINRHHGPHSLVLGHSICDNPR